MCKNGGSCRVAGILLRRNSVQIRPAGVMFDLVMQTNLFEPDSDAAVTSSINWINSVLFNEIAVVLCVLAVAFLGGLMLLGRLPVRSGLRIIIGCFVLFGAPIIAAGLVGLSQEGQNAGPQVAQLPESSPRDQLPPSDYNPYAQASVREND